MTYRSRPLAGENTMTEEGGRSKTIVIVYFDGCPNWKTAAARIREVAGTEPALERIGSSEEAERRQFRGSPTILIDGIDPFAESSAPIGLSCRVYRTENGVEGSPSVAQLRSVMSGGPGG